MNNYGKNKQLKTMPGKNCPCGKTGFTLVEILVSITILSIIMISVMGIFISATDISLKSDINRIMQENIKNVVETIAEDVRKNGILGVSKGITDSCNFNFTNLSNYKKGTMLCTGTNRYWLAKDNGLGDGDNVIVSDSLTECSLIKNHCFIVKNGAPLSNSLVSFKNLNFYVSKEAIPKVTVNFILQPAVKRGIKSSLIQENKIKFQTTISERFIKTN